MPGLILIVVLLFVMWLLLIRPQRRRQLDQQRMIESVEVGEEIVTAGGLYGTVVALDEGEARLEIAEGTVVRIDKRAIAAVLREDEEEAEEETEEPDTAEPDEEREANLSPGP